MNVIKQYKDKGINFISIENNNFKVVLADWAASLYEVWLDNKLMTLQVKDPQHFKYEFSWFGKTIGRFAGRIAQGKLTIDNKQYILPTNEMGNTLHGGPDGLSNKVFKLKDIVNNKNKTKVIYQYLSKDKESGFMGNLLLDVIYDIDTSKNEIKITFKAECDKKSPINITNHVFFTLGEESIDNLKLLVKADKFVWPRGLDLLPIEVRDIVDCLDFNSFKYIKKDIYDPYINSGRARGYDHCFLFKETNPSIAQVQLESDKYHLDVYTDYSSCVIYSDNFTCKYECTNTPNYYHRGLAIEAQCSPLSDCIIPAKKQIQHFVRFVINKK